MRCSRSPNARHLSRLPKLVLLLLILIVICVDVPNLLGACIGCLGRRIFHLHPRGSISMQWPGICTALCSRAAGIRAGSAAIPACHPATLHMLGGMHRFSAKPARFHIIDSIGSKPMLPHAAHVPPMPDACRWSLSGRPHQGRICRVGRHRPLTRMRSMTRERVSPLRASSCLARSAAARSSSWAAQQAVTPCRQGTTPG